MKSQEIDMFLFLEDSEAVYMGNVISLVRGVGETVILMSDGSVRTTCFTPRTLRSKSEKFWEEATLRKEQLIRCRKKRSKKTD